MDEKDQIITRALDQGRNVLSEYESKLLLHACGIPVTREEEVRDEDALLRACDRIGYPVAIKGCSPHLAHKTEQGLVRVDVRDREEARGAFREIFPVVQDMGGAVLVQEMVKGSRELMAGMTRDPQFGPCVMFGLGGIFTEILKDVSFRVAPIEKRDALEMMQEIRGRRILEAVRGMPAADLDQICRILTGLGDLGVQHEAIQEIDLNPVILSGSAPVVVDALVVLAKK
ncbi:MAG: acetate--CoA ligase family protein [Deltaproteobacteria bacterium]|nr:acetate--CoA ligase family protein [Deltaproteobacteria bacterium]